MERSSVPYPEDDIDHLVQEHSVLLRHCGEVQQRCTAQIQTQAGEITWLQSQVIRMRAQIIMLLSALTWEREDHQALQASAAHRPKTAGPPLQDGFAPVRQRPVDTLLEQSPSDQSCDLEWLEYSLRAADLVICQTGCVSHGSFWRVQDHCKRTGKACVLIEQPDALRIVRIHPADLAPPQLATKDAS